MDKASQVSQQAGEQAKAVAGTAVEQARQVGSEAAARAGDLVATPETRPAAKRKPRRNASPIR